jgi:hypothetical protein
MTVLTICRDGSITVGYSILSSIADAFSGNNRPVETAPEIAKLPKVRRKKIIRVCKQIDNGTYDLDERLDAVLERILMDITP